MFMLYNLSLSWVKKTFFWPPYNSYHYLWLLLLEFVVTCTLKICSYEGRCGLPTNFDSSYCYALGYGAAALLQSGKTGLISSVCANTLFIYLLIIKLNISSRLVLMIYFGLFGNIWAIDSIFGFAYLNRLQICVLL